jgi:hypothetical protein
MGINVFLWHAWRMTLVEHAERELRAAGLFDEDSDYGGMLGPDVLELVRTFAAQGHSGCSAHIAIDLFRRVASYQILTPLKNPMISGEYMEVSGGVLQSTRKSSVFSNDAGKTWHDIDKRVPRWKQLLGIRRFVIRNWAA